VIATVSSLRFALCSLPFALCSLLFAAFLNVFKKVLDRRNFTGVSCVQLIERVQKRRRHTMALTIWVARTLHKNGRVFLVDVFHGNEALADSVNHLLVVGFYLINFGYVSMALKLSEKVFNAQQGIEALSVKVGMVLIVLGGMHFFNLFIFSRMRRRARIVNGAPPVPPDGFTQVREA
jgi:hypothetical protein